MEVGEGLVDVLNHLPVENEHFTSLKNIVAGKDLEIIILVMNLLLANISDLYMILDIIII